MKRKLESRKLSETEKMLNKLKQYSEEKEQEVYDLQDYTKTQDSKILTYKKRIKNRNTIIVTLAAVVLATLLIK